MRASFLAILAVAATISGPAFAQTGVGAGTSTNPTVHQPNGAVVPNPSAVPSTNRQGDVTTENDPTVTGSITSRDTTGMRQSPENRNALGCRQIDPLCQGGR